MNLPLTEGESIVKSWAYGKARGSLIGGDRQEMSLTVTNKRIINMVDGKKSFSQSEIPIDQVKSVNGSCAKHSRLGLLIFGIILLIVGIICVIAFPPLCAIGLIFGVLLLILFFLLRGAKINLRIDLENESSNGITISSIGTHSNSKKGAKIKIRVNYDVAKQMLNELGALIDSVKKSA